MPAVVVRGGRLGITFSDLLQFANGIASALASGGSTTRARELLFDGIRTTPNPLGWPYTELGAGRPSLVYAAPRPEVDPTADSLSGAGSRNDPPVGQSLRTGSDRNRR